MKERYVVGIVDGVEYVAFNREQIPMMRIAFEQANDRKARRRLADEF